ncbi:MAG: class I SAM-dependent DNA methyltransferase, partial [Chloroflexi bacterium]|nr:class I SAM-dependent DNA methyltransferase [Chloroflexota bacterium]
MSRITPQQFVAKWSKIQQKETAVSQSHFNDICHLIGHKPPIEHDPAGKNFPFETQTIKPDGAKGFADVFFRSKFIWKYKGPHADLKKAYQQLQLYREDLQHPPLLITSDIHTIEIHTNFNNYPIQKQIITFDDILTG